MSRNPVTFYKVAKVLPLLFKLRTSFCQSYIFSIYENISSNYSKANRLRKRGFLILIYFLTTLEFVLVIFLDETISVYNDCHYCSYLTF